MRAAGHGRLGTVALDGMKIAASASKSANRTEEGLRKLASRRWRRTRRPMRPKMSCSARGSGGMRCRRRRGRRSGAVERIRRALADLEAERKAAKEPEQAKAEAFRERQRAGQRTGCSPASAAVELAEENLARVRAARAAQLRRQQRYAAGSPAVAARLAAGVDGYCRVRQARARWRGRGPGPPGRTQGHGEGRIRKGPGPVRNITDPDSRLMPVRGGGFIQGYNAQNMTSEDELIIATELTDDPTDMRWFEPMLAKGRQAAALIQAHRPAASPGRLQHDGTSAAASGWPWPMPGTAPRPTSPAPARTGSSRSASAATWKKPPAARTARAQTGRPGAGHARAAQDRRRDRRLPPARPHRRDPARPHQAQHGPAPAVHPRQAQSQRRMDVHLRHVQPVQGHHHRPPHPPGPGRPGQLTLPTALRAPAQAGDPVMHPPQNQFRNSPSAI